MEISLFLVLLALFAYIIAVDQITTVHKNYLAFHFFMMLWPLCNYLTTITPDQGLQWIFLNIAFVANLFAGYSWLVFSLTLTRKIYSMKKTTLYLAALPAVIFSAAITTNPWHYLFARPCTNGWNCVPQYGPLFWVMILLIAIYIASTVVIMFKARQTVGDHMFKQQFDICLAVSLGFILFPLADIILNVFTLTDRYIPGLTTTGITLMAVCFVVAIRRYDLFRIVSIAQREIIDNMAVGVVVLNNNGTVIGGNKSAAKFIDTRPGNYFDPDQLFALPNQKVDEKYFLEDYKAGKFEKLQVETNLGNKGKRVLINVTPVIGDDNNILGRIITLSDITELHNLLDEVSQKNHVLEQQNLELQRVKEELDRTGIYRRAILSNVSHELRTPVTLIQGYLKGILDGVITDRDEQNKNLELVYKKTLGLGRLIEDLFQLSQLKSRQVSFDFVSVPADSLISRLFYEYELDVKSAGKNITLQGIPCFESPAGAAVKGGKSSGSYPLVSVDIERIEQVFGNLISNAIKYTEQGGEIVIGFEPEPGMNAAAKESGDESAGYEASEPPDKKQQWKEVLISVKDNGPGIAEVDIPYIFNRFYRGSNSGGFVKGSGIGLALAKEIINIHGGRIWVESKIGQGSTFYFSLPVLCPA